MEDFLQLASATSNPSNILSPALWVASDASTLLPLLLPSVVVLLAIDVGVRISSRTEKAPNTPPDENVPHPSPSPSLKTISIRASQVLQDFEHLEQQLASEKTRRQRPKAPRLRRLTPSQPEAYVQGKNECTTFMPQCYTHFAAEAIQSRRMTSAFAAFCERLILTNHAWKREKELKTLRAKARLTEQAKCSNAFKAFCDRLLLTNKVWKLENEAKDLVAEAERLKRSRVAAVTRAAKKMVLDVRKERLIEEFVKDLIVEVEESKRSVKSLREHHEREIQEIMGEWTRDYRSLVREVQQLRLALQAKLVEQEVSNDIEQSLYDRLSALRHQEDAIQASLDVDKTPTDGYSRYTVEDDSDDETLSGDPEMNTDMSTSTCVSLPDRDPKGSPNVRRRTVSESQYRPSKLRIPLRPVKRQTPHVSPSMKSPDRRLNTGSYAGFSFNPLFFGPPESITTHTHKELSLKSSSSSSVPEEAQRSRPVLPKLSTQTRPRHTSSVASLSQQKTNPWKV